MTAHAIPQPNVNTQTPKIVSNNALSVVQRLCVAGLMIPPQFPDLE
jgi:hypothetical protein